MAAYPGFMTKVTCGLTAKQPRSAASPTLVIEYGTTLFKLSYAQHKLWNDKNNKCHCSVLKQLHVSHSSNNVTVIFKCLTGHCYYTVSQNKWGTHIFPHNSHKNRAL